MTKLIKFGRKVALRSAIQIEHELCLIAGFDDLAKAGSWEAATEPTDDALHDVAGELARAQNLSIDRGTMLVGRFGDSHPTLQIIAAIASPGAH